MLPSFKATGAQRSWFAEVKGERLPCVHKQWRQGFQYRDSTVRSNDPQWREFFASIADGKQVIETSSAMPEGVDGPWKRDGYVGLFRVENVTFDGTTFEFAYAERIANLL